MYNEYIDVEIIIVEDEQESLTIEQMDLLSEFDIITKGEYENIDINIYEDFSVCYPPERYDDIINMLMILPDDKYSFRMFDDENNIIKQYGELEVDREEIFVFNTKYN